MTNREKVRKKIIDAKPSPKLLVKTEGTILVVDDNDALRYSLVRSLREAGYRVIEAKTGTEALELAGASPDLITLDINLPDIDGFQVCRKLKSAKETSHIPVLHVSSTFTDPEARVFGLQEGADGYLAEPIDRAELIATVAALLRLKNAEMQARLEAAAAEQARRELSQLNETLEDRIKERTAELKSANENLRQLSTDLLHARDEEQRRIAREIHDGIGQLVAAVCINNSAVSRESGRLTRQAVEALEQNAAMLQELVKSVRTISHLLHPPLLDEVGLYSALEWYVDEFSKRSGIEVGLYCPEDLTRVSSELETTVFRIVQECLGNVHRHSGSRTANVRFEVVDGTARLQVRDNGVGIPASRQHEIKTRGRGGVGLRGIRERVSQFGGELQIDSSDQGTTVTAMLPWGTNEQTSAAAWGA